MEIPPPLPSARVVKARRWDLSARCSVRVAMVRQESVERLAAAAVVRDSASLELQQQPTLEQSRRVGVATAEQGLLLDH